MQINVVKAYSWSDRLVLNSIRRKAQAAECALRECLEQLGPVVRPSIRRTLIKTIDYMVQIQEQPP